MKIKHRIMYIIVTTVSTAVIYGDPAAFIVHPKNHRLFVYRGKPMKILTSAEHYGIVINGDFDYKQHERYRTQVRNG